jgi:iron complex transport system permease protein
MTATLTTPAPAIDQLAAALRTTRRRDRRHRLLVLAALGVIALGLLAASVAWGGSVTIAPTQIVAALLGDGDQLTSFVILDKRLPRAVVALLVGALFGMSGVIYQRLIGNPLATPDIIGISAGASAGAVAVLVVGGAGLAVSGGAIVGAIVAALIVFALSWRGGTATYRLVLVGIGIGACCAAITSYLLTFADSMQTTRAMRWLIGSLSTVTPGDVLPLASAVLAGGVLVGLLSSDLSALRLGDGPAAGLGTRVDPVRICVVLLGATLAAIATSVVGPIGFVALVSGPIAARLLPTSGPFAAALVGAVVVAAADLIAQAAPLISPVPTGVITGLVGAPVLIYLLITQGARR